MEAIVISFSARRPFSWPDCQVLASDLAEAAGESGELGLFDLAEVLWQEHHIPLHRHTRKHRTKPTEPACLEISPQHRRMFQEVKRAGPSDF